MRATASSTSPTSSSRSRSRSHSHAPRAGGTDHLMDLALIFAVITIALVFDYTNGFHDAANAIATSVSTRALTPRAALIMAALMNLLGAFLGTGVAQTVGSGIVDLPQVDASLIVVLAGVLGAIVWNLITWWFGLPSSS